MYLTGRMTLIGGRDCDAEGCSQFSWMNFLLAQLLETAYEVEVIVKLVSFGKSSDWKELRND